MKFNTALLHGAFSGERHTGSTHMPIYQVSAFAHESAELLEKIFNNKAPGFAYTRIGNPTISAFEKRIANLEGGIDAVACSSGMAAVAMALLNILQSGNEIIASTGLFGGTIDLFSDLAVFGITTRYVNDVIPSEIEPLINKNTKVVFTELIGNPKLDVVDIEAVSKITKRYNIPLIVDSTPATPALIRPLEHGADIVVHSSSKYINGSGNAISGIIVDGGKFAWNFEKYPVLSKYAFTGKLAYTTRLRQDTWRNFGACLAPGNAYLNSIGMETLGLRMEKLCANALALAKSLEENSAITHVNYPGLKSSPYKENADRELHRGMAGAILTIRAGSKKRAFSLINNLKYALIATNIGDTRTLVIHPASTIYAHSSDEQKRNAGVCDDLIRISVGIEDIEDIVDDFAQAIDKLEV